MAAILCVEEKRGLICFLYFYGSGVRGLCVCVCVRVRSVPLWPHAIHGAPLHAVTPRPHAKSPPATRHRQTSPNPHQAFISTVAFVALSALTMHLHKVQFVRELLTNNDSCARTATFLFPLIKETRNLFIHSCINASRPGAVQE